MFRFVLVVFVVLTATVSQAGEVFPNYRTLMNYVDNQIMKRDFVPLITRLGGEDEYTEEELDVLSAQLLDVLPFDFTEVEILASENLSDTFTQEIRAYWNDQNSYAFIYFLLHERNGGLVVQNFHFSTSATEVMSRM